MVLVVDRSLSVPMRLRLEQAGAVAWEIGETLEGAGVAWVEGARRG